MKNELKFSIIAAAYNEEKHIKNFLSFWTDQNYDNYEIIVVDDGSKDNTVKFIKEFQKNNNKIILIENKINKGVGYSRYIGFLAVTGEILKFSDTDISNDYPHDPTFTERLIKPFAEDNEVDVVYIDYTPFVDQNNFIRTMENIFYSARVAKAPTDYKTRTTPSGHMPTVFRRKNIDLTSLYNIKNGEDRFIAENFLKISRKRALAQGEYKFDGAILNLHNLYKRHFNYGKNSLGLWKVNKLIFFKHIIRPFALILSILLFIFGLIYNWLLCTPFILILIIFEIITIKYSHGYLKSKKILIKAILLGPLILAIRYIYIFFGTTQITNQSKK